jgi:acetyl-CoA C-acetyltransferase
MVKEAVIVGYLRSPFSRSRPREPERDAFNSLRMDDVTAKLIQKIIKKTGIDPKEIGDVLTGTAFPVGEQWLYGGRSIVFLAGLPIEVPAQCIDRQCASSMSTVHQGAMEIQLGYSDVVFSCGMEHMTHNPMPGPGIEMERIMVDTNPRFFSDQELDRYEMQTSLFMGLTAEKLFKYRQENPPHITKREMDEWSLRSHKMAAKALEEGFFRGEIMPIEVADGRVIDSDLSIRADTTLEKIESLPPAFTEGGSITAGNSSPLNAGASALLMMTREKAREYGLDPMAKIVSLGWAGVDPSMMGLGPVPASRKALKHAGLEVKDIDFWEINEAFAVVALNTIKELGIDPDRVNVKGSAIAIGHPLGATGTRLVGTLARILEAENGTYGLATPCVGGGQGTATIIGRL